MNQVHLIVRGAMAVKIHHRFFCRTQTKRMILQPTVYATVFTAILLIGISDQRSMTVNSSSES